MRVTRMKWLRRFIRRHTNPIDESAAEKWERRLSLGYMFFASNVFIAVCYMCYTGRADWAEYYGFKSPEDKLVPKGVQWAKTLGVDNAKVIRFSGFNKIDEYDIVDREKVPNSNSTTEE